MTCPQRWTRHEQRGSLTREAIRLINELTELTAAVSKSPAYAG